MNDSMPDMGPDKYREAMEAARLLSDHDLASLVHGMAREQLRRCGGLVSLTQKGEGDLLVTLVTAVGEFPGELLCAMMRGLNDAVKEAGL